MVVWDNPLKVLIEMLPIFALVLTPLRHIIPRWWVISLSQKKTDIESSNKTKRLLPLSANKTRETRVLSRPTICWIHFVQIDLSISTEHLNWASQSSISAIFKNAQQCSTMFKNALKHSDMLINAQQCSIMLRNA